MAQRCTAGTNYLAATASLPNYNASYTQMGWAKMVSPSSGDSVGIWRHGVSNDDRDDVHFIDFGSGYQAWAIVKNAGSGPFFGGSTVTADTWIHYAFVRDGTAVRFYSNGSLVASDTSDPAGRTASTVFSVCQLFSGDANAVDVEGYKFFDRALTAEEIAVEMLRTMPVDARATNAWPFVDASNGLDFLGNCPLTVTGTLGAADPVGTQFRGPVDDFIVVPAASGNQTITANGLASTTAFGGAQVNQQVLANGLASTSAFGAGAVNQSIAAAGLASTSAFGTAAISQQVRADGLASTSAFGTAMINQQIIADGLASTTAFGTAVINGPPPGDGSLLLLFV